MIMIMQRRLTKSLYAILNGEIVKQAYHQLLTVFSFTLLYHATIDKVHLRPHNQKQIVFILRIVD